MISDVLMQYGCSISDPDELYTELFWIGDHKIQKSGEYRTDTGEFKGNPMIYVNDGDRYHGQMKRYILLEDTFLEQLHDAQKQPSNLINGVSYFGKKKDKEHGDKCFGLIFDIDKVDDASVENFMFAMRNGIYPSPNFIVISKSGEGLHLYYLLDEPIRLFPRIKIQLKELKYALTRLMWNPYTSREENVQFQSYDQSFMIAGTTDTMKVFRCSSSRCSLKELSGYVYSDFDYSDLWIESRYTLEQAKKKFPEWYEKVIVNGENLNGTWTNKPDLYNWWLRKIREGASYGHRFWCVMMLTIYAIKCDIPFEKLEEDAYGLIPFLDSINKQEPFTRHDVRSALECYDIQFKHFPIDDISRLSGIPIQKNKRNGRTQEKHLAGARAIRDINNDNWREGNGRKSKENIVREWRSKHPDGRKCECARDTGLSKPTVYKHWD